METAKPKELWEKVKSFFKNMSMKVRIILCAAVVLVVAGIIVAAVLLTNSQPYTTLFTELSTTEASSIRTYLLENGQIKTTYSRAKEVAPIAEKMITLAKKNNLAAYRQVLAYVTKEDVAKKLFDQIGPKYADRNGGYTRVLKLGPRRGDAAEMAIIQLV